jgi:prolyl-tRNA editing enzyme YbaK/EbsC (Cys-tRNA(Pro) deacylase)/gamma-glutamylcyclotransferase (GGCT)/AIG2-like uncharacterized protein YtfP
MSAPRYPLFVYGTLRLGEENHRFLDGHYLRTISAELAGYARIHPLMIASNPQGRVDGELYFLMPDEYDATIAACDELEELDPGQLVGRDYQRKLVHVTTAEGPFEAWAYVRPETVFQAIRDWLKASGVCFREVRHPPTRTSEESAAARGEPLHIGGKALLLKAEDDSYRLFVLPADAKLDSQAVRQQLGLKKMRFATAEELLALTGLVPGSVPPFGRPILPFDLYVDQRTAENDRIAFNAGSLTDSIILATTDYLAIAKPQAVFRFAKR